MKKGKSENAFEGLMSRQDYLVVQANDLAKAFGNLKAFEHKLLDYCFSYVTKEKHCNRYIYDKCKRGAEALWIERFREKL